MIQKPIQKLVKIFISVICYYLGLIWFARHVFPRRGVLILAFHRVNDHAVDILNLRVRVKDFETQLTYLRKHYRLVSLQEAIDTLRSEKNLPSNTVVITFDDGYTDNYLHAFPILQKLSIPATIFLTLEPIETRSALWFDEIQGCILSTHVHSVDLRKFSLPAFPIATRKQKQKMIEHIVEEIKRNWDFKKVPMFIDYLHRQLSVPRKNGKSDLMLTWEQVTDMKGGGIEFGAHTMTHPILTHIGDQELNYEIAKAKEILEGKVGAPVAFFAYPNGEARDFNAVVVDRLKSCGYRGACTLIPGVNSEPNFFSLKRLGIDEDYTGFAGHFTKEVFAAEMTGILDCLFFRKWR